MIYRNSTFRGVAEYRSFFRKLFSETLIQTLTPIFEQCKNRAYANITNWQLTLTDVKLQPFNMTSDGTYGTIEDCKEDTKDDWLVPG